MIKRRVNSKEVMPTIIKGVNQIYEAVSVTLGPRGRLVLIEQDYGNPRVTKDGVTVAKSISVSGDHGLGLELVKSASIHTGESAGDGTTTTVVLCHSIVTKAIKHLSAGANSEELKKGIESATSIIKSELRNKSTKVDSKEWLVSIATISANNDREIGEMAADAADKLGPDGVITVEEGKGRDTEYEIVPGMHFDKGYVSPSFLPDKSKSKIELQDAYILLTDRKISSIQVILPLLDKVAQSGKPLVIIAENVEGEALTTLILNNMRKVINVVVVKAPGFGANRTAMLEDIAAVTDCEFFSEELGAKLDNITLEQLGRASKVEVSLDRTIIASDKMNDRVEMRVAAIKEEMKNTSSEYDKEKLQERGAKLISGVAVIRVGADTEVEMKEKKDRADDAVNATRAAVEEGVVPGGGMALLRASAALSKEIEQYEKDEKASYDMLLGMKCMMEAIKAPAAKIIQNAQLESSVILHNILENSDYGYGYDVRSGEYVNMLDSGVIDATKVIRIALEKASSVACILVSIACIVSNDESDKSSKQNDMPYPMGM